MSNLSNIKLTPKQNLVAVLFILLILAALGLRLHFSNKAYAIAGPGFIVSTDTTVAFVYNTDIYQLDKEGNILGKIPFNELGLRHKVTDIQLLDDNRFVIGDWLNEEIVLCEFKRRSCESLTQHLGKHIRDFFMFHYEESDNSLFISDTTNHRILHYDVNSHQSKVLSNKGEFLYPNHLSIEEDGYLYVADSNHNRIAKFTYNDGSLKQQGNDITVPDNISKQNWLLHFSRLQNGGLYVLAANYSLINSGLIYFPVSGEIENINLPKGSKVTTFSLMGNKLLLSDKALFKLYLFNKLNGEITDFGSDELKAVFKKDLSKSQLWDLASDGMLILLVIVVIGMVLFILYLAKKGNKLPDEEIKKGVNFELPPIVPGKLVWLTPNPMIRKLIPALIILVVVMAGMFYAIFDFFGISLDKAEPDSPEFKIIQAMGLMAFLFVMIFINVINNIYYKIGTDGIYIYINKIFKKYKIQPRYIAYNDTHLLFGSISLVYRNKMKHYFSDKAQFESYITPLLSKFSKQVSGMAGFVHTLKNPGLLTVFNILMGVLLIYYMVKLGLIFG